MSDPIYFGPLTPGVHKIRAEIVDAAHQVIDVQTIHFCQACRSSPRRTASISGERMMVVRTAHGWRIESRTLHPLDGSEPAQALLHEVVARPSASP